jgi:hypothetical protein
LHACEFIISIVFCSSLLCAFGTCILFTPRVTLSSRVGSEMLRRRGSSSVASRITTYAGGSARCTDHYLYVCHEMVFYAQM